MESTVAIKEASAQWNRIISSNASFQQEVTKETLRLQKVASSSKNSASSLRIARDENQRLIKKLRLDLASAKKIEAEAMEVYGISKTRAAKYTRAAFAAMTTY